MNLIFMDLDGTLEDSRIDMIESVNSVREYFELNPLKPLMIEPNVKQGMEHLYRSCFAEMFPGGAQNRGRPEASVMEEIRRAYEADYRKNVSHHTVPYNGIPEAVEKLADMGVLAVYTNKPQQISRKLLLELDLSEYFSFIIGCDTFEETKPSPKPMQRIARDADFDRAKDKCFMIGDSGGDMKAAAAFDAVSIWCSWGYYKEAPVEPAPRFTVNTPAELPGLIEEHGSPDEPGS